MYQQPTQHTWADHQPQDQKVVSVASNPHIRVRSAAANMISASWRYALRVQSHKVSSQSFPPAIVRKYAGYKSTCLCPPFLDRQTPQRGDLRHRFCFFYARRVATTERLWLRHYPQYMPAFFPLHVCRGRLQIKDDCGGRTATDCARMQAAVKVSSSGEHHDTSPSMLATADRTRNMMIAPEIPRF